MTDNPFRLPLPKGPDFKKLVSRLDGDWLVTSDWHLPFYSLELATKMLTWAEGFSIRNILVAGDLFNFGYLSRFEEFYESFASGEEHLDGDLEMGRQLCQALLKRMDRMVLVGGNHDRRLQRSVRNRLSIRKMFHMFVPDELKEQVYVPALPYVHLDSPSGEYRITHPEAYSKIPLRIPQELCYQHECHVIAGHGHHFAVGIAKDGKHVLAESGGLFDPDRIDYKYLGGDNTHPQWCPGFLIVKEGRVFPYGGLIGV